MTEANTGQTYYILRRYVIRLSRNVCELFTRGRRCSTAATLTFCGMLPRCAASVSVRRSVSGRRNSRHECNSREAWSELTRTRLENYSFACHRLKLTWSYVHGHMEISFAIYNHRVNVRIQVVGVLPTWVSDLRLCIVECDPDLRDILLSD